MKTYDPSDIRNVLLVGHGGSGKTTLLEAMLFASGATTRMGTVEDGNTVSDFEPEEIEEGHQRVARDGAGGVERREDQRPRRPRIRGLHRGRPRSAIRAADAVLLVVSAVDGVEVQTEVAWELAVEAGLPRAILINKLDRERASFERTLDQLVQAFGTQVAPLELPIGEEHDFEGVADLLSQKAYRYDASGKPTEGEWPDDIHGEGRPLPREARGGRRRGRRQPDREVPGGGRALRGRGRPRREGGVRRGADRSGPLRFGDEADRRRPRAPVHRRRVPLPR